jgi:hypothetical protein
MNPQPLLHRLTLAVALTLSAASLVAVAGEARETTDIEVVSNGTSEKVSIADLKVGETRQLYSEAGTLVTATRTAESLELDIAGDRTSIKMFDHGALDDPELAALIEAHAGAEGGEAKHVVRIHRDHADAAHATHADGKQHRVIVLSDKDGAALRHGGEHEKFLIERGADGAEGKRVIVKRRLVKDEASATK